VARDEQILDVVAIDVGRVKVKGTVAEIPDRLGIEMNHVTALNGENPEHGDESEALEKPSGHDAPPCRARGPLIG
jgi:hypothetical protein